MRLRLLLAVAFLGPLAARATPNFPEAIARDVQASGPPACTICHATNSGGSGTVVKPFGKYLVSRGLAPFDERSLSGALAAAAGERHDTDGDGILDVDALKQGLDPNGSTAHTSTLEDPTFGCSSTGAGAATNTLLLALAVLLRLVAARMAVRRGLERAESSAPPA
ncbi:MAG TPA: hypothetical protein VFI53_07070 [Myxococcaceae bacterium]|nr:hypothetical protein [Myxococcaceae bacterium]